MSTNSNTSKFVRDIIKECKRIIGENKPLNECHINTITDINHNIQDLRPVERLRYLIENIGFLEELSCKSSNDLLAWWISELKELNYYTNDELMLYMYSKTNKINDSRICGACNMGDCPDCPYTQCENENIMDDLPF